MKQATTALLISAGFGFLTLIGEATADCWRLPTGQVIVSNANSTPPMRGAQRVPCSSEAPVLPAAPKTAPAPPAASNADPCQQFYGKGYCTDWIAQKLGSRPHGDPKNWPVNHNLGAIREHVAVVFAGITASGHVAYVEGVRRDPTGKPMQLEISEMNYGRGLRPNTPPSCLVTSMFGAVGHRTISLHDTGITGFWPQ